MLQLLDLVVVRGLGDQLIDVEEIPLGGDLEPGVLLADAVAAQQRRMGPARTAGPHALGHDPSVHEIDPGGRRPSAERRGRKRRDLGRARRRKDGQRASFMAGVELERRRAGRAGHRGRDVRSGDVVLVLGREAIVDGRRRAGAGRPRIEMGTEGEGIWMGGKEGVSGRGRGQGLLIREFGPLGRLGREVLRGVERTVDDVSFVVVVEETTAAEVDGQRAGTEIFVVGRHGVRRRCGCCGGGGDGGGGGVPSVVLNSSWAFVGCSYRRRGSFLTASPYQRRRAQRRLDAPQDRCGTRWHSRC